MEFEFKVNHEVVNPVRPDWGIGKILSVEPGPGGKGNRVRVNFAGAGVKTMMIPPGRLALSVAKTDPDPSRPLEDRLRAIPAIIGDRQAALADRIAELIRLHQFQDTPKGIFDWAVYQLGRKDPLNDFTADELKAYFEDFKRLLKRATKKLYQEIVTSGGRERFKSCLEGKAVTSILDKIYHDVDAV
jgi:hypothetical protein